MFSNVESNNTTTLTGSWTSTAKTIDNTFDFGDLVELLKTRNVRTALKFSGLGVERMLFGFVSSVSLTNETFYVYTGTPLGTHDTIVFSKVNGVWTTT